MSTVMKAGRIMTAESQYSFGRPRFSRRTQASSCTALLVALVAFGCEAGFGPERTGPQPPPLERELWAVEEVDLLDHLGETESGRILRESINAHGGWDRWRELRRLTYRRSRERATRATGEREEVDDFTFDLRSADELGAVELLFMVPPFVLVRPELRREALGVEVDIERGLTFEKVLFELTAAQGTDADRSTTVVYFDAQTHLVKQVLRALPGGTWELVRLDGWESIGGLRVATRRRVFELPGRFRRISDDNKRWLDTIADVVWNQPD